MRGADRTHVGEQLFLEQLTLIERVIAGICSRNHCSASDKEDFASYAKLKIIEDDYGVLRKFQGLSSLKAYLNVVIQHQFLDYRINVWGKWRPSAAAKRAGAVGILLEQLMKRDGYSFDEACELLRTRHDVVAAHEELEQIAGTFVDRVVHHFESEDGLADIPAATVPPDELITERDRQEACDRLSAAMQSALTGVNTQDRLLLTLRFRDGRKVSDIAKMLRLDAKVLYRRLGQLLDALKENIEQRGFAATAVIEMLQSPGIHLHWDLEDVEDDDRPSAPGGGRAWR
jgi:RNA polymerase sigma factor for flagellar operon FliA